MLYIQFNDYTDIKWLYRHEMTIQTLNDYTDIKYYTDIKWLYIHDILYI